VAVLSGVGAERGPRNDEDDEFHGHSHWLDPSQAGEDVEGLEKFSLRSVGIDIGSSTSHLVFSHLTLRREGAALSARFAVTERSVVYRSPILLTPYASGTQIDLDRLSDFFHGAYTEAGLTPAEIDTGAVVITGEALKKENAQPIAELFATESGKFICASAGPNHEALLAAHGSGAVALSADEGMDVLNVDIGGGTSKISLIRRGVVEQTVAVEVGARLLAFDEAGSVVRVEQPARALLGESIELGDSLGQPRRARFARVMAGVLLEVIRGGPLSPLARRLLLTEPLHLPGGLASIGALVFSGGVSEYIYGREAQSYGDCGPLLADAIRAHLAELPPLREPTEGIRATVIGAGEYTVQVSGNTSYVSDAEVLPVHGLKVVRGVKDQPLERALAKFDLDRFTTGLALAVAVDGQPDYRSVRRLAESIAALVAEAPADIPLFLVLDMDIAVSLGGMLQDELGLTRPIVAIDGIDVGDLDYIDIGRPMGVSQSVPVTVKSLLFPTPG
jgi:ethanolamine utilization protein EutA